MKKTLIAVLALLLTATLFITNTTAQEKITGPWLWIIAPTEANEGGANSIDIDSLAIASGGTVTESDIATNGANAGGRIGNFVWTLGEISETGSDNINECLNRIGMINGDVNDHSSYALFQFKVDTVQHGVTMHVGSDDAIKVWLNGKVVHNNAVNRGAGGFQDNFQVNLVAGENLLLVKVSERGGDWSMFVGMDALLGEIVSIPDLNLASAIREAAQLPSGTPITTRTMERLQGIQIHNRGIRDLTGLQLAMNLQQLVLEDESLIADFSPLEKLPQLTSLSLNGTAVWNVTPLANLTQLKALSLRETAIDLSFLASLTQLETLDLSSTGVSDVSPLASLTQLQTLNLGSTGVSDVSPLASLTQLETLDLSSTGVSDVSPLASLTQLQTLNLGSTGVSDVSPLASLTQLETLDLSSTGVSDVSPLASLTQLQTLNLRSTGVSDVVPLANLTQLEKLEINNTGVVDVVPLANLTQLKTLNLAGTDLSDIVPLANLTQLEWLDLGGTDVWDVTPFTSLTQLEWLNLTNTDVSDVTSLTNLTQLKALNLNSTDVADMSLLFVGNLRLENCPLSYTAIHTYIPAMQARGIWVEFDNVAHPALLKFFGDGQEGEPGVPLEKPFVVKAMDEHGKPMVGRTVQFDILEGRGTLSSNTVKTDASGNARVTLTLGRTTGVNKVKASVVGIRSWVLFTALAIGTASELALDVNGDGVVNILDLTAVSGQFGETGENRADVNGDGAVNIQDLVLVAGAFGEGAAAPSARAVSLARLTASDVERWLGEARAVGGTSLSRYEMHKDQEVSPTGKSQDQKALLQLRGIVALEQLLANLIPKETALLANYPNPFNPETWIPYQLANPAEVTVTIYAANGAVVRTLNFGHRRAGSYASRSRAAYWDGRNAQGESVASGVYFYTLTAGDFAATRKMLILK